MTAPRRTLLGSALAGSLLHGGLMRALLGAGLMALLAGDAAPVGIETGRSGTRTASAAWRETDWPFPLDQWGTGRAFRCAAADCGAEIVLYLRPKVGFCNCASGVSDDDDLDRVGDLELFSDQFVGLADGRRIDVGPLKGRSRFYRVTIPHAPERDILAIAFNDKCDVAVATVVAARERLPSAERAALEFLSSPPVLRWASAELGAQ